MDDLHGVRQSCPKIRHFVRLGRDIYLTLYPSPPSGEGLEDRPPDSLSVLERGCNLRLPGGEFFSSNARARLIPTGGPWRAGMMLKNGAMSRGREMAATIPASGKLSGSAQPTDAKAAKNP